MIDDPVGCLTGEPIPSGMDWDVYWAFVQQRDKKVLDSWEESLFNPL